MVELDFDYWKKLAESDPAAFFQARQQAIDEFIAQHSHERNALVDMQTRIDATRLTAGSPRQASRALLGMMEEQLHILALKLDELHRETAALRHGIHKETAA